VNCPFKFISNYKKRRRAHEPLCRAAYIYSSVKTPLPASKTRVWNKDWWDVVLLPFTGDECKENYRMTNMCHLWHFI